MTATSTRPRVIALLAVRNRAAATKVCLDTLLAPHDDFVVTKAIVVDDGSTDTTPELLRSYGERVLTIRTDGNAYWAGGMRLAEARARAESSDYVLWVNDDADLEDDAIARVIATHQQAADARAIVTGVMVDPVDNTVVTYGGNIQRTRNWYAFDLCPLSKEVQSADAANGNLLLFPRATFDTLGGIDSAFTHHFGDWDITLRASQQGIPVLVSPGFHGTTVRNRVIPRGEMTRSRREEWQAALGPKGMPPKEQLLVLRRNARLWPIQYVRIYAGAFVRYFLYPRKK